MNIVLQNPWLLIIAVLVGLFVALIWRSYVEYKWPFHKKRHH